MEPKESFIQWCLGWILSCAHTLAKEKDKNFKQLELNLVRAETFLFTNCEKKGKLIEKHKHCTKGIEKSDYLNLNSSSATH